MYTGGRYLPRLADGRRPLGAEADRIQGAQDVDTDSGPADWAPSRTPRSRAA